MQNGIGTLQQLGINGLLSSLAIKPSPGYTEQHAGCESGTTSLTVPMLSLRTVIDAIPSKIRISMLKTDLQGYDFAVVKSAGSVALSRVETILAETRLGTISSYVLPEGVPSNHLVKSWFPYMNANGFVTRNAIEEINGIQEADVLWRRIDIVQQEQTPRTTEEQSTRLINEASGTMPSRWRAPNAVSLRITVTNEDCTASERKRGLPSCARDVTFSVEKGDDANHAARAWCDKNASPLEYEICVSRLVSAVMYGMNYDAA
eukprot:g582.t1